MRRKCATIEAQAPATGSTVTVSGSQGNFILQGYDPQGNAIVTPLNSDGTPAVKNGNPITASVPSENIIPEEAGNTSASLRSGSIAYIDGIPYSVDQVDGENAIIHRLNTDGTPVNDEQGNPVTSIVPIASLSTTPDSAQKENGTSAHQSHTQPAPAAEDNSQPATQQAALSQTETDSNGLPFVKASDGSLDFGTVGRHQAVAIGSIVEAPIRLSIGNEGYGLTHMEKHAAQILQNGYRSIEDFVEDVSRNYDEIRQGNLYTDPVTGKTKETFLFVKKGDKGNVLYIELSPDKQYYEVNSGGIFKNRYIEKREVLWNAGTQHSATSGESQGFPPAQLNPESDGVSALPQSSSPVGKDRENEGNTQGNSPLERIPIDKKGKPIYEQSDPETAYDAILEQAEGDTALASRVILSMIDNKEAALNKLSKAKPRRADNPADIIKAEKELAAQIKQAESNLQFWKNTALVPSLRNQAQKEAEANSVIQDPSLADTPDITDDSPSDARKRGFRRYAGSRIDRSEPLHPARGNAAEIRFSAKQVIPVHAAVIEADEIIPSHINGQRNPKHFLDEAQPKERTDQASVMAARQIAADLRPEEITSLTTAYSGAPVINARGEVIQGNNRSAALREMWSSYPEQAARYRQYLIDHAAQLGIDPASIQNMKAPVLVAIADVSDQEAIRLGQYTQTDLESGGTERIKPQNAITAMGNNVKNFANILLQSTDENASLSELLDRNALAALKWMQAKGYITPTQYQSAVDARGNVTAEAKNDLRNILFSMSFKGAAPQLRSMFDNLPARAQRAILTTTYRDMENPEEQSLIPELQNSIRAFHYLMQYPAFAAATNYKDARSAIEAWKRQFAIDDVTGDSFLPAEKFSNFALILAASYKGCPQSLIQNIFTGIYDIIQGSRQPNLFDTLDNTPKSLQEAINTTIQELLPQEHNFNYNGTTRSNLLAGNSATSQQPRQGSDGTSTTGERAEDGNEQSNRGTGTDRDSETSSSANGDVGLRDTDRSGTERPADEGQGGLPQSKGIRLSAEEVASLLSQMEDNATAAPHVELSEETWSREFPDGNVSTPMGVVKFGENQLAKLFLKKRQDEFGMLKPTLENPDVVINEPSHAKNGAQGERKSSYLFVKTFIYGGKKVKYYTSVTVLKDGMEVVISNHISGRNAIEKKMQENEILHLNEKYSPNSSDRHLAEHSKSVPDLLPTQGEYMSSPEGSTSSISHADDAAPAISLQSRDDVISSDSKDTVNSEDTQYLGEKIAAAEAQTETKPSQAQKEDETKHPGTTSSFDDIHPIGHGAFGDIYDQFKGKPQKAIEFLSEKQGGEAIGALHHKDVGDIDLVWGNEGTGHSDGFGLAKLVKYHPEVLNDLQSLIDNMHVVSRTANRINLESKTHKATVRLEWDGVKKNWLLTAFEKENSVRDNTTDTGTTVTGKQNDTATLQNTVSDNKDSDSPSKKQADPIEGDFDTLDTAFDNLFNAIQEEVDATTGNTILFRELPDQSTTQEQTNDRFNNELSRQIDGTLPKGHIYDLGMPSDTLLNAGLPNLPIEMAASRLSDKSMQENHPFDISEIRNLPKAIQSPMAIFRSATRLGSFVVMTEIEHHGRNFVVAIQANRRKGRIEVNSIRSVHYRTSNSHIANWVTEGLLEYADKKRMVEWLSKQRYNSADVRKLFNHATKIIQNFDNPKNNSENIRLREMAAEVADAARPAQVTRQIERLAREMNLPIEIIHAIDDIPDEYTRRYIQGEIDGLPHTIAGYYDRSSGKAYIILPAILQTADPLAEAERTILHEVIAHHGMQALMGRDAYDTLCDEVWQSLPYETRARFAAYVLRKNPRDLTITDIARVAASPALRRAAADEYIAALAEGGVENPTLWQRIKAFFRSILRRMHLYSINPTDADIRYLLSQARENLAQTSTESAKAILQESNDIRFKYTNVNGINMSENAKKALEDGKTDVGKELELAYFIKESGLGTWNGEYHHVGKNYNRHYFVKLNDGVTLPAARKAFKKYLEDKRKAEIKAVLDKYPDAMTRQQVIDAGGSVFPAENRTHKDIAYAGGEYWYIPIAENTSHEDVKNRIEDLFNKAVSGDLKGKPVSIGTLTKEGKYYLEKLSGITFKDRVDFVLNPSDLVHIYKRHFGGNEKDGRNIPLDINDIRSIADIISNPDKVIFSVEEGAQERKMFSFLKEAEEGSYNLLEIYSDKKGNLTAKSFYKSKEGVSQRAISLTRTLHSTSETDGATLNTDAKIPQMFEISDMENENLHQPDTDTDIRFRELSAPEETIDNASRQGNDYARDARTHAAASIDTHSPDLSPVEQAEAVRFRELLTRDFSAASDFLNSANLINAAMQANDGKAAWLNNIQEAVFDSMLRLRLLLDRMKKDGASIPAGFNPYLAENQSRSRAQDRIAAFNEDYRRPLIVTLAKCINKLREENIGVAIKDNNAAHEALSLYAQARAAVERQEVKEREAREQAKADGTEYKHREWAGLPGIQYAIIALYNGEITDDVEANKNNLQWLQDFATENNIPTVEQYITMVEDALQKENIDNLWENIRRISEFQLTTSRDAGILSRGSYQLLTYGYNIDEIIETLYKEQRKKITDDINNGIGDKDSLAADLADLDRRHLEAVATATDLDAPDAITTLVAGGWITQDIANDIHRYYNYYLPLKGHAEITGEDLFDYNTPSMPRNASRIKSVRGHEQLARDPFNQILRDAEGCIVQAERNRWKQQLYHVLSTNRSLANGQYAIQRKYYQVIKLDDGTVRYEPYQRVVTTENNEDIITFVPTSEEIAAGTAVLLNSSAKFDIYVSQKQRSEHETIVYIDGSPISILFYDARIAKAVNGTNEAYPPQWMPRAIIKASRTIPALLTSWHPEFVLLSNPIRDTQEAIANAAIDKGFKYTALLARNLATVDRDLWAYTGGKLKQKKDNGQPLSQYEKYVTEFFENGGAVNITQLADYDTTTKDLKKELKRALKGGTKPSKNFWKRLTEQTELRTRIATYITSRQTGSTIQDAINDAKEITVNFDRRGAQFRNFNLLQMFFNAQMQSVRRQTELMRRHPVRYATTVAILASSKVLIGLGISLLLGGGDDDNTTAEDIIRRYFEINKQLRTRNHIFIIDGEVYRIPVAPAFIPFTTLCEEAAQLAFDPSSRHRNTASKALLSVTSSVLETYVPTLISDPANIMININNEQAWRQSFASGIPMSGRALWQPFIEAIYNYDYTGNPIYTEPQFGAQHLPFHRDYRERTGKAYVYTSKILSDLTGGNNVIPGKINIHPEQIEHVVQGLAGGIGTLAGRFTGIYKRVQGESAESAGLQLLYDIPFAARLYGGNMQQRENRYYQSLFFDDKQALEAFRAQQRYIESSQDMQDFDKEYNRETRKYFYDFATADKLATKVRKWRDAHQKGSPEYKQYEAILQDIYRTTDDAFNRLQQSNDNEPYEIIDNPYYIYNNIESQLDKELYNVNGSYMTIDDAARAWAARTRRDKKQYYTLSGDLRQIAKIRDEVKEIKSRGYLSMTAGAMERQPV